MKCSACWADKAYVRKVNGWRGMLLSLGLRVPLKCHHCYHKFSVSWFSTIGAQVTPPPLRMPETARPATTPVAQQQASSKPAASRAA